MFFGRLSSFHLFSFLLHFPHHQKKKKKKVWLVEEEQQVEEEEQAVDVDLSNTVVGKSYNVGGTIGR